jgi:hypothetical protein
MALVVFFMAAFDELLLVQRSKLAYADPSEGGGRS